MATNEEKLQALAESEGFDDVDEFVEEMMAADRWPAICMNDGCDYTEDLEPDQDQGWCDDCGDNTMKSWGILRGII